jgi:hypothetical protein
VGCGAPSGGDVVGQSAGEIAAGAVYNFGTLAHPGACMDAQGAGTADGTQIQEWWCNGTGAQSFAVQHAGNGAYYLVNTHANECVDVQARGTANGTKILLLLGFLLQPEPPVLRGAQPRGAERARPATPPSAFYQSPPFNTYAQWVHAKCPGIDAFPYDDYGSTNQSSDHTCSGATQLNVTFCPRG